jgi:hypothetical protein
MTDDDRKQRRYRIELCTGPATSEEGSRRLRAFLKSALRAFGLRCVDAVEIETQSQKETNQ